MIMEPITVEVKHSESKTAWNVVGTRLGSKYKIARVPYMRMGDDRIDTMNKFEALQHASFIVEAFNDHYRSKI